MDEKGTSSYFFKIKSFSLLVKSGIETYVSRIFQAGGYNWKLILYPAGNKQDNGTGYISLYLAIEDSSLLASPDEVYARLTFFVYNAKQDIYLTINDSNVKRFSIERPKWGQSKLLPLGVFNDATIGYLNDDQCTFGVEVSVAKMCETGEHFSILEKPTDGKFSWKINLFSTFDSQSRLSSDEFCVGDTKWKLCVYPRGDTKANGKSLSMYLTLAEESRLVPDVRVYAIYKLRVLDQRNSNHAEKQGGNWFNKSSFGWGYRSFIYLSELQDPSEGFIVDDNLTVEVEFEAVSVTKYFP